MKLYTYLFMPNKKEKDYLADRSIMPPATGRHRAKQQTSTREPFQNITPSWKLLTEWLFDIGQRTPCIQKSWFLVA